MAEKGSVLEMMAIGVDPHLQEKKIGDQLLKVAMEAGRKREFKFAFAITNHHKSKHLFQKNGCQIIA